VASISLSLKKKQWCNSTNGSK